ncbi:histone H2B.2-like [Argentina anserina]|uniref:histone H2B.2-like n=1 Tax=Argentina anserina TaxID=57926 RepID=UPI0021761E26|nr:histone H2B.2-like [Potentilla anserina]
MGPKRRSSSRLMVKTTKQVVKETVEVSVVQSKKRQKKVNDDEQQELSETTIAIETKEENKTEKVEVSVDKEPTKIIPIESQEEIAAQDKEPEETRTIPVEYAAVGTPERQEGTTPCVDKEQQEEKRGDPAVDKEDVAVETQQEESETQNYEEARDTISMDTQEESGTQNFEETPMTPEKKEENQSSKGEEEKSVDVKQTGGGEEKKEKKRKRRSPGKNREGGDGYKRYVYKVLKQVHPELGMSAKAMVVLNNYMHDMFERLADEAAKLTMYTTRKTLSAREIQGAVKLVLPGELGKHAMAEGTKAVSTYLSKSASRSKKS